MTNVTTNKVAVTSINTVVDELGLLPGMNIRQLAEKCFFSQYNVTAKQFVEVVFTVYPTGKDSRGRTIDTTEKCYPWYKNNFSKKDSNIQEKAKQKAQFNTALSQLSDKDKKAVLVQLANDNLEMLLEKVDLTKYLDIVKA